MNRISLKKYYLEVLLIIFSLIFSFWLMFHTFSYSDGSMQIATKAWSDFGNHIPLIRSFSKGDNFPPEYPLFPGEPIRYHFLFYSFVGLLERLGIRIDYALNIPSAIGFTGLLLVIYIFAKTVFKNRAVGILSVVFFLFNGSFSFLEFFKDHPLSVDLIRNIVTNTTFPAFAPYGKGIVSAFWNLNIYTNQRHLALAYSLSLLLIFLILQNVIREKKPSVLFASMIGIVIGMLFFLHMAVFLITVLILAGIFLFFPKLRLTSFISLFLAGIVALPQYLILQGGSYSSIILHPGYLIENNLKPLTFFYYWFSNLGLHMIIMLTGFIVAPQIAKKVFIIFIPIFLIGNLFQFSPDIAVNHKFFNYFMLVGIMFSAYFLVYLWKKRKVFAPFVIICVFLLTFSGIIDFFPVFNDPKGPLADYPKNPDILWIMKNTPNDAVFLNSSYLYNPASLAGRKIFLGWPYFAWSQGYDTTSRDRLRKQILSGGDLNFFCSVINKNSIDFVEIEKIDPNEDFKINNSFFENNFPIVYKNLNHNYTIYDVANICG